MRTRDDIEAYLARSNHPHRELAEGTWLVGDSSGTRENIVIRVADELCIFRMKVIELAAVEPTQARDFYLSLLELNATDVVHGAYGVADGMVLLTASLPLENLDYNEFVGVIEDFILAMTNHHARLAQFHRKSA
jgi:hypothetical protein